MHLYLHCDDFGSARIYVLVSGCLYRMRPRIGNFARDGGCGAVGCFASKSCWLVMIQKHINRFFTAWGALIDPTIRPTMKTSNTTMMILSAHISKLQRDRELALEALNAALDALSDRPATRHMTAICKVQDAITELETNEPE